MKHKWSEWSEGFLTWCEECGNSDSQLRMCPDCDMEFCYSCAQDHHKHCLENEDNET